MEKAARSSLLASISCISLLALLSCAYRARELPPDLSALPPSQRILPEDYQSPEYSLSCDALSQELNGVRQRLSDLDKRIRETQTDNQAKAAAGLLLFTPLMLTLEIDEGTKNEFFEVEARRERILRIAQARGCPI